ncbi:hypothetical protein XPA_001282 [Xanthoria parietina]
MSSCLWRQLILARFDRSGIGDDNRACIPNLWVFVDILLHHGMTLLVFQDDNLNAALLQIFFATDEGFVFPNDYTSYFVHDASPSAHIARGQGGVHSCSFISSGLKPAGVFQS